MKLFLPTPFFQLQYHPQSKLGLYGSTRSTSLFQFKIQFCTNLQVRTVTPLRLSFRVSQVKKVFRRNDQLSWCTLIIRSGILCAAIYMIACRIASFWGALRCTHYLAVVSGWCTVQLFRWIEVWIVNRKVHLRSGGFSLGCSRLKQFLWFVFRYGH